MNNITLANLSMYRRIKSNERRIINLRNVFKSNENILVLAPHPDDEVIACGGALMFNSKLANKITCCFMTDGGKSSTDKSIVQIRKEEAQKVHQIIGTACLEFGSAKDLELYCNNLNIDEMYDRLLLLKPNIIYTPSPFEFHPDHYNTFCILIEALKRIMNENKLTWECSILIYSVWNEAISNASLDITEYWERKKELLDNYISQQSFNILELSEYANKLSAIRIRLPIGSYAESFYYINYKELKSFIECNRGGLGWN